MDTAVGLCDVARDHLKATRWAEGEAAARRAIELDARSDDAHALLGVALCRLGRSADGIDALGQAVHLNPANISARFNLASARQQAGHLEAARAELHAVLGLDPNNTKARGALAVVDWQIAQATPGAATGGAPQGSPFAFDLPGMPAGAPARPPGAPPAASYPPAQPAAASFAPQQPTPGYAPQPQAAPSHQPQPAVRYDLAGNPIPVQPPPQNSYAPPPQPAYQPPQPYGATPLYGSPQPRYGTGRGASGGHAGAGASSDDDPGGWSLDNITAILFSPSEFFASQQGFSGLVKPLLFGVINQAVLGAVVLVATLVRLMTAASSSGSSAGLAVGAGIVGGLIGLVTGLVFGVAIQFAVAGLVHLLVMLFGGRRPFGATYRALIYASVPATLAYCVVMLIVMVAPSAAIIAGVLVLVAAVWGLVLSVMGLSVLQDISAVMAFLALFLTGIVIVIVAVLLGGALGVVLSRLGGAVTNGPYGGGFGSNNPFGGGQTYQSPFGRRSGFGSGPPGFGGPSGFPGPGGMRGPSGFPGFPNR